MGYDLRHRYRKTEVTFGPVGRVVATVVVLGILWFLFRLGIFGWVAIVALSASGHVRQALRDIWRQVPDPAHKPVEAPRPELPADYVPPSEREAPRRW